jgi:CRISPR/Cas system CSM-associated protein Csm2 small subunit
VAQKQDDILASLVTGAQLYDVAKEAREKWLEIGIALHFGMVELAGYEEREPKSLQRRLLRMLKDWMEKEECPTVGALVEACSTAGVGGAVKRVLGLLQVRRDLALPEVSEVTTVRRKVVETGHEEPGVDSKDLQSETGVAQKQDDILASLVTGAQLYDVAKEAREKWLEIGIALHFGMVELAGYEEREPKSLQRRLLRMLKDWMEKEECPTVGALVEACSTAGVGGAVKRVLGLLQVRRDLALPEVSEVTTVRRKVVETGHEEPGVDSKDLLSEAGSPSMMFCMQVLCSHNDLSVPKVLASWYNETCSFHC